MLLRFDDVGESASEFWDILEGWRWMVLVYVLRCDCDCHSGTTTCAPIREGIVVSDRAEIWFACCLVAKNAWTRKAEVMQ